MFTPEENRLLRVRLTEWLATGLLLAYGGYKGNSGIGPLEHAAGARGPCARGGFDERVRGDLHDNDRKRRLSGGRPFVIQRELDRSELTDAVITLRRLLDAVRAREVCAPADAVARLEGAVIALDAVATGKTPLADVLLVPGPYTI